MKSSEALRRHGFHRRNCPLQFLLWSFDEGSACTCGLAAAIREAEGMEAEVERLRADRDACAESDRMTQERVVRLIEANDRLRAVVEAAQGLEHICTHHRYLFCGACAMAKVVAALDGKEGG